MYIIVNVVYFKDSKEQCNGKYWLESSEYVLPALQVP